MSSDSKIVMSICNGLYLTSFICDSPLIVLHPSVFLFWNLVQPQRSSWPVAVRQPYIRVVGIQQTSEANSRGPTNFSVDEVVISTLINCIHINILSSHPTVIRVGILRGSG